MMRVAQMYTAAAASAVCVSGEREYNIARGYTAVGTRAYKHYSSSRLAAASVRADHTCIGAQTASWQRQPSHTLHLMRWRWSVRWWHCDHSRLTRFCKLDRTRMLYTARVCAVTAPMRPHTRTRTRMYTRVHVHELQVVGGAAYVLASCQRCGARSCVQLVG